MPDIKCDVEPVGTRLLVRVTGELSLPTVPRLRVALLKCLVEQPDALVVDLGGTRIISSTAASVLLSVAKQAALWPGTLLLIVAPPSVAELIPGGHQRPAVFGSVAEALAATPRRRTSSLGDVLLPVTGATRRARELAGEACARWDLPELSDAAALIAGEFAANAADHAQTMADLRFSLGRRYLMIAVRDGSTSVPVIPSSTSTEPAAPRGLLLVEAMSHRWGTMPARDGKVVWAALRRPSR